MSSAYELAQKEVGTYEWAQGANPKVVAYYRDAGHPEVKDDAVAWCAAFVGAMLQRSGVKPTGSLAARSYLDWGKVVDPAEAQPGDICIFKRGTGWQGHVAFFVKQTPTMITVLGGNQSDAVNIKNFSKASLIGVRRAVQADPALAAPMTPAKPTSPSTAHSGGLARLLAAILALFTRRR